ncbi:TetR family transcriptional regulator [Streptomyces sp. NPDC047515]|uniref:TetR/AcrR family transcriptional regulator n=1 Tax=Streptomyces sp. NPDC047515 TaxID=3155380 RepID=UPI0033ED3DB2
MTGGRLPSLTERRREATRLEIAEAAAELFSGRGYEATTVEAIAQAAGVSLRTFYRYCPAKEDALTPLLVAGVVDLVDELAARPEDEPLGAAVAAAFVATAIDRRHAGTGRNRRLIRVMSMVPAIRMRWLAAGRAMRDRLLPVLAARTGNAADSLEVRLLATVVIDAVTVALEHWAERDAGDLSEVTVRALEFLKVDEI